MTKPQHYTDLPQDVQDEQVPLLQWDCTTLLAYPDLAQHIAQASMVAKERGLIIDGTAVYRERTDYEKDQTLYEYRTAWDVGDELLDMVKQGVLDLQANELSVDAHQALTTYLHFEGMSMQDAYDLFGFDQTEDPEPANPDDDIPDLSPDPVIEPDDEDKDLIADPDKP